MKKNIGKAAALLLLCGATAAYAAKQDAGTPLYSLIQPGFYGLVDIGNGPPPPVVYAQPILIAPPAVTSRLASIYLHVPPQHARNWKKHCNEYKACSKPVYFVRSGEYVRDAYYSHDGHQHDYEQYRYEAHAEAAHRGT